MPLYEYQCDACGHRSEVLQRLSDPPLEKCPECGSPVRKVQSAAAFQFKGTGWYITDYARKDQARAAGEKQEAGEKKEAGAGSEEGSKAGEKSNGKEGGESSRKEGREGSKGEKSEAPATSSKSDSKSDSASSTSPTKS